MARRKGRDGARGGDGLLLVALGLVVAVAIVVQSAQEHPVITALIIVGVLGAAAGVVYRRIARTRRLAEHERTVAVTDAMSGPEFEQFIARLMRASGCRQVAVCGGAGDKGADVIGYAPDGRRLVVQCKRYKNTVGSPEVQRFAGTAHRIHGADIALLVTNGRLTRQAWEVANRCDIIAFDRNRLAIWLSTNVPPIPGWPTTGLVGAASSRRPGPVVASRPMRRPPKTARGGAINVQAAPPPIVPTQRSTGSSAPSGPVSTTTPPSGSDWWSDPGPV